jgi:hypothetical protein
LACKTSKSTTQFHICHFTFTICHLHQLLFPLNRLPHRIQALEKAVSSAASLAAHLAVIARHGRRPKRIYQTKVTVGRVEICKHQLAAESAELAATGDDGLLIHVVSDV